MSAAWCRLLVACAACLPLLAAAEPGVVAAKPLGKPVVLRGTLDGANIQMNLRPKEEFADGLEGHYFWFGTSHNVLLAGEVDGAEVFMEESENGTDVSGEWNGKLDGDTFSGEWMSAGGTVKKPFSLRIIRGDERAGQASSARAERRN